MPPVRVSCPHVQDQRGGPAPGAGGGIRPPGRPASLQHLPRPCPRAAPAPADASRLCPLGTGRAEPQPPPLCRGQVGLPCWDVGEGPWLRNSRSSITQGAGHRRSHVARQRRPVPSLPGLNSGPPMPGSTAGSADPCARGKAKSGRQRERRGDTAAPAGGAAPRPVPLPDRSLCPHAGRGPHEALGIPRNHLQGGNSE